MALGEFQRSTTVLETRNILHFLRESDFLRSPAIQVLYSCRVRHEINSIEMVGVFRTVYVPAEARE